jgi:Poly(R)-hydroxyalkanoic acid synthase subunit (PHA_synth_III_E)
MTNSGVDALVSAIQDHAAACQALFEQLTTQGSGGIPSSTAFMAPWKAFAGRLGMPWEPDAPAMFSPETLVPGGLPALGVSREYQEIVQRLAALASRFQSRYAEFARHSEDITQTAFRSVQQRHADGLAERPAARSSPEMLYSSWIDCAEQAYAQAAHGEPFARTIGDLCNILSEFKIERGRLLERIARHLDLPSRAEIDSLHHQVRALTLAARNVAAPVKGRRGARPVRPRPKP